MRPTTNGLGIDLFHGMFEEGVNGSHYQKDAHNDDEYDSPKIRDVTSYAMFAGLQFTK